MHGSFCRVVCLALIAPVLLFSSPVSSEELLPANQGMELHLFRPAVDTKGHFTTDATNVLPHLAISLGMMLDFGFNHWIAVEQSDNKDFYRQTLMERAITANFMFNLGLFNRFVLGFQIPIAVTAGTAYDGDDEADEGDDWSNKGGFGDLAIHLKAALLRADRYPVGLGILLQYQFGSGQGALLMGEPGNAGALSGKIIADMQPVDWYKLALNVGLRFPFSNSAKNNMNSDFPGGANELLFYYGPLLSAGVGQSFGIWPRRMELVIEAYVSQLMTRFADRAYFSMEINGGFKIYIDGKSYLIAGAAAGIPVADTRSGYGFQSAQWRLFLGIAFEPSIGDRDGDGIPDDADECPDEPEDKDGFEDEDGCPEWDNDKDGIPDREDDCPLVPEDRDGDEDEDGCPEHDEVNDRDGDGIIDEDDECPDDPEDKDGFEDADGCPDPDNDRDGIPDAQDNCPLEREILNGVDDEDGCPDEGEELVKITDDQFQLLKGINFKYDSDEIVGEQSFEILNAVVAVLKASQNMQVRVEGHTDSRGSRNYNIGLSKRRAASVVKYLIQNGVAKHRLRSQGFGPDQPIASNDTDEGRAKNRRVVFAIIQR